MSKTKRFDIETAEPNGTTFTARPAHFAGNKQSKRTARFGIGDGDPTGITFEPDLSHINFPKADVGVRDVKTISETSGQGEYEPSAKGSPNATTAASGGGSIAVGKSSPKKGGHMSTKARW